MIKEALQLIQDVAVQAASPHKLPAAQHRRRLLLPNGTIDEVTDSIPPRLHTIHDVDSLSRFVADMPDVVIWHNEREVVAVLNDASYRDSTVSMPLPIHPTFAALAAMTGKDFGQKSLIDYLRLNLKKEVDAALPGFIGSLRSVKIEKDETGDADIQHGRESMGRRIKQSVAGIDALPEDFVLDVPLWLHLDCAVRVECALLIDTAKETFRCGPKPGAIEQSKVYGQIWLGEQLDSACERATVYFGAP